MKKIKPKYDKDGNMIMTDGIWKRLSFWNKIKLILILQAKGKYIVKANKDKI